MSENKVARFSGFLGGLAAVTLLGACASSGPPPGREALPCSPDCKRTALALADTANLSGSIDLGKDPNVNTLQRITETTDKRVHCALETVPGLANEWQTVWGPVVVLKPKQLSPPHSKAPQTVQPEVPANTMLVAKRKDANVYVVAIAGTDPASLFDWVQEDAAATPVLWPGTCFLRGIRVTQGTLTGLRILEGMQWKNTTLKKFLQGIAAQRATIYITGHSLGGALAPALGLSLVKQKRDWDPRSNTTLHVYSFAGATPGDRKFAKYVHKFFPGGAGNNDMVVVDNSLDVVPHAFNLQTLKKLDTLYLESPTTCTPDSTQPICIYPGKPERKGIKAAIDKVWVASALGIEFATLGEGSQVQGFTGTLKSAQELADLRDCPLLALAAKADDYVKEAIYQHVCAYPLALGDTTLIPSLTACREKYPDGLAPSSQP